MKCIRLVVSALVRASAEHRLTARLGIARIGIAERGNETSV